MFTAGTVWSVFHFFNFPVDIRNVCVLLAPWFASNTALATYFFTYEIDERKSTALLAAAFVAIVPAYISRSVAGSFDNEGIAIFALVLTFYMWVKAVKTGSLYWSALCSLAYFYMVSAWGGYVFIINLIPMHVISLLVLGRFSHRLYVAYSTFYILGSMLAMQISFVGFQHVQSSEHMVAMGTFVFIQIYAGSEWVHFHVGDEVYKQFWRVAIPSLVGLTVVVATIGQLTGYISPWTGRFYSLLDPTYAKKHIPIIASVSEHQPTTWASFFFDLHIQALLFPAGLYFCFQSLSDVQIFAVLYGVTSIYFAGVMVRLILVLAPISCVLSAIAVSRTLGVYMEYVKPRPRKVSAKNVIEFQAKRDIGFFMISMITLFLFLYVSHSTWATSEAYSSPSIVLSAKGMDGSRVIFDDFREAYWWLRMNTPEDAHIMSWWDYGYQVTAMANRTVLVDNNTWNNTHISQVGQAMASEEDVSIQIIRKLDVDYVLVIFGGVTGYSSDDINKFLWMVRIGGSTNPNIQENDYYSSRGEFRIDSAGSNKLLNCLMYKLCYYRFGQVYTDKDKPGGWDRVREAEIGNKNFKLKYFEEAYTSEHWIVRIYKVKDIENRDES
eukprot:TRINITY_DN2428_c0_g1_i1.p1 TRINITY_DN2428_c0_g1~~TRINITY_DN2428_c0_g1_i1.p1  ORF type:complete len:609 (-),score=92.91 TRINITY_DN2428_c0_g1_i1:41-1867(-)